MALMRSRHSSGMPVHIVAVGRARSPAREGSRGRGGPRRDRRGRGRWLGRRNSQPRLIVSRLPSEPSGPTPGAGFARTRCRARSCRRPRRSCRSRAPPYPAPSWRCRIRGGTRRSCGRTLVFAEPLLAADDGRRDRAVGVAVGGEALLRVHVARRSVESAARRPRIVEFSPEKRNCSLIGELEVVERRDSRP